MSFLIHHRPWQPGRMVITLPKGMRLVDKIIAYVAVMHANAAIERMMQVDSK